MGHFTQVSGSCWNTFEALESSTGGRGVFQAINFIGISTCHATVGQVGLREGSSASCLKKVPEMSCHSIDSGRSKWADTQMIQIREWDPSDGCG